MTLSKKYLAPFFITSMILILLGIGRNVDAAVLSGRIDTTGAITGQAGATYYDTDSWKDMMDTYHHVRPNAASNRTVYFNVVRDVPGAPDIGGYNYANTGNTNNGVSIVEGKSLSINGNGRRLYLDTDTNYTTAGAGSGAGAGYIRGPFRVPNSGVSQFTVLEVKNAYIINNITGGIFQSVGRGGSEPTFVYQDVTVSNGAPTAGAQPIRNDNGRILFFGNNTFNIRQNNNMTTVGLTGADNQGEWIQGGKWVEVVSGTTTLNQNWGWDQPFYTYNNNAHTLKVADNARLVWNLNDTYCMYYDDGNSGPMVWDIGDNASFDIKGTENTAARNNGGWFLSVANNSWTLNIGNNGRLAVTTGGGNINLNGFVGTGVVRWNIGQNASLLLNNLKTTASLVAGSPGVGSGMVLNDSKVVTLNTAGGSVFDYTVNANNNFPITITGRGLRTHTSTTAARFDTAKLDLVAPNRNNLGTRDVWYRQNTGRITGLGAITDSALTPNNYSRVDLVNMNNARYISWYQPIGLWLDAGQSSMTRTFNISLNPNDANGTPANGSWSNLINGNAAQRLVLGDDRGQAPNFHLTVTMMENNFSDRLSYYWSDPANKENTAEFRKGIALPIVSVTSDAKLPSYISMANAGQNYTVNVPSSAGIRIRAKNTLLSQTGTRAGIFKYTLAHGPA
ncbi:RTX toxin [Lactococcus muris]|uniref:RTX toxin n=1 Tax=Lactococcus muris TaxID=2941330 RepID=A0ABV4DAI6_9LACT